LIKNILVLASGSVFAQGIVLLTIPILSRLYTPSSYGDFALFIAMLAIISPFSTFRYESAILISDDKYPVFSILFLCALIVIISSVLLSVFGIDLLVFIFPEIAAFNYLILATFFFAGFSEVLTVWHIRFERFKFIAIGRGIQAVATVSFQIGFEQWFGSSTLVYGYTFGLAILFVFYFVILIKKDNKLLDFRRSAGFLGEVAKKYKNFPLYSTWATLLNGLSNQLPILLFGRFFSAASTGNYEMSRRLLRAPLGLIGQAVFRVVSQRVGSVASFEDKAAVILGDVFKHTANYTIIPFIVIVLLLEPLFDVILGPSWIEASIYGKMVSPWLFTIFLSWPMTSAYNTFGHQIYLIVFNIVFSVAILIGFGAHLLFELKAEQVLMIVAALSSISRLWYCYWILDKVGFKKVNLRVGLAFMYTVMIFYVSLL
jgi:lipopolysaccharide exporter